VTKENLFDHVNVIVSSRCAGSRSGLQRGVLGGRGRFVGTSVCTTPVIFHLLVQLLLCLARAGIRTALSRRAVVATTTTTSASAATVGGAVGALSGDVAVDVLGCGSGDVAAVSAAATTASAAVIGSGAQATGIAGTLDAVHEAGSGVLGGVEGVAFAAAGNEGETNGLALGVGSVIFLDRSVCILQAGICDVSDSLGASSAVIRKSEFRNRSNPAEEILLKKKKKTLLGVVLLCRYSI
jgi:hypothetical protein